MKVTAALELMLQGLATAQHVGQMIARARAEGRETISEEDMNAVVGADDGARARLVQAIEAARAEGR